MSARPRCRGRGSRLPIAPLGLLLLQACAPPAPPVTPGSDGGAVGSMATFRGEAWADNWFAVYLGDRLVAEDAVPITTERSFNAETFTFQAAPPFTLAFVIKDYKANDSGLEYIGLPNQQMGDGGFSFQLTDATTGRVVLASDRTWRCLVVHRAPLNKECEKDPDPVRTCRAEITQEPAGWRAAGFDDRAWPAAVEHTAAEVGPKEGYLQIRWDPSAKLIWSADLHVDNTLLCRVTLPS